MRRALLVAALLAGVTVRPVAQTAGDPQISALLKQAATWLENLEQQFAVVVADEAYHQQIGTERYPNAPKENFRELQSEVVFLWVPDEDMWVTGRSVRTVDKEPVQGSSRRIQEVLSEADTRAQRVRGMRSESTRFNLGVIYRNFNDPTFALQYLDTRWQDRFRWARRGRERVRGQETWRVDFTEVNSPYLVQAIGAGDTLPSSGSVWIDGATGIVYQTRLEVWDPKERVRATIEVDLARDSRLALVVPVQMREEYTAFYPQRLDVRTVIFGKADYTNFRRFETSGRLIEP